VKNLLRMTVTKCTQQLEGYPFLFYIFQEWAGAGVVRVGAFRGWISIIPHPVIKRAMDELTD